ncbi:MAG: ribonuclease HI family protein [Armatimonadota bacterium]
MDETRLDKFVVYVDGCSLGNPGDAGIGVVIEGPHGDVLWAAGEPLQRTTNNVAEYTALLRGLEEASRLGATSVLVYTDSELLSRQISGEYRVRQAHLRPLYNEAQRRLSRFRTASVMHISRDDNAGADDLARRAARTRRKVVPDLGE